MRQGERAWTFLETTAWLSPAEALSHSAERFLVDLRKDPKWLRKEWVEKARREARTALRALEKALDLARQAREALPLGERALEEEPGLLSERVGYILRAQDEARALLLALEALMRRTPEDLQEETDLLEGAVESAVGIGRLSVKARDYLIEVALRSPVEEVSQEGDG